MSSLRRLISSRANAAKSTGPKTDAGKRRSSRNALRNGFRTQTVVLPNESRHEFDTLLQALLSRLGPRNSSERACVSQMAISDWRMRRLRTVENGMWKVALACQPPGDAQGKLTGACSMLCAIPAFRALSRYESAEYHTFTRAHLNLVEMRRREHQAHLDNTIFTNKATLCFPYPNVVHLEEGSQSWLQPVFNQLGAQHKACGASVSSIIAPYPGCALHQALTPPPTPGKSTLDITIFTNEATLCFPYPDSAPRQPPHLCTPRQHPDPPVSRHPEDDIVVLNRMFLRQSLRNSGTLLLLLALSPALQAATLYVSPEGHADWSGRLAAPNAQSTDGPLPSLDTARDAIRKMRDQGTHAGKPESVTVFVRAGTYRLSETFTLTAADSNVTYAAYVNEHPVISGGQVIKGWSKSHGNIWTAPATGDFHQLFINGRRAQRARSPNYGFYRIDGRSSQDKPFLLKFRGNEIRQSWETSRDVEAIVLLAWAEIRMPITAVDEATHIATLAGNPRPSNKEIDARYWIENAPDALDMAGEWYLDKKAGAVSYWPMWGEDLNHDEVVAPVLQQLARLDGAHDVTFRGLDFRHADWTIGPQGFADSQAAVQAGSAIEAVAADHVVVENCRFSELGGYALWLGRGCKRGRISANEIFDMGGGGIKVGEIVIRNNEADQNSDHVISDNRIHNIGLVYPAAHGVWIAQSSHNTVSHNDIHDLFYTAISVGWTWGYAANPCHHNIIEFNHLYNIGQGMLSDMGAIYTLGVQEGTIIRNNLIHDVTSFTYGGWGIYPDEGSSNLVIENNIVYRTNRASFHQHYGANNLVRNNVFAYGGESQIVRERVEDHLSFTFDRNIIYFDSGVLLGAHWTGNQYRMNHNLYWDARGYPIRPAGKSWEEWQASGQDAESVVADPMFADPASGNFKLSPHSPAWKLGWKAIDMSTVGPRW